VFGVAGVDIRQMLVEELISREPFNE